jgi:cytochrome b subunit of formate dehydrogenase
MGTAGAARDAQRGGDRRVAARVAALAAALVVVVARAGAAADEAACLACHGERIDAGRFAASVHGPLGCPVCHTDIEDFPHPERPAQPDCATCHADVTAAQAASAHGRPADAGGPARAGCPDCHGDVHAIVPHDDAGSPVHWTHQAQTCARCHAGAEADRYRIPVVRPVEAYSKSVHARAVAAGRRAAVCADCHGAHGIVPASDPASPLARANVAATCGACHTEIGTLYRASVHGEALGAGVRDAPTCTDCHGEHTILPHTDPASPVFATNVAGETCGRCHQSLRLSEKYGLPAGQVRSFEESYHGLALRAGHVEAANCASCHGVHDIQPSSDPRSHVNAANLPATCGRCHPGAGTNFALGPVHVPLGAASAGTALGWIRFVYLWLIATVIGGMTLHNGLDLRRKSRRVPYVPPPGTPPPAERMMRPLRWQHALVMVSFVGLVYTGFALTYPEHWWTAPLLVTEPRLNLRALLHRVFAVVLLVAVAWHVGLLVLSARTRRCFRGMMWSTADLRELRERVAWFLGWRATPPHTATFGYIEKAEYWAFMWGTLLMAVTGFVLWFENVSLRWLPKWATDVATALHFYEAVLASLAIAVWHLYWVVFDPDVYPMDRTWLDGRPPAARALERTAADGDGA